MRKVSVLLLVLVVLVLTACQVQSTSERVRESSSTPTTNNETEQITSENESSSEVVVEPVIEEPVYLDEANYSGDELEIIQLINARIRYLWEEDEQQYLQLFQEQSGVSSMPSYKIEAVTFTSDLTIKEQRTLYEGLVFLEEIRFGGKKSPSMYVFTKIKGEGDSARWQFAGID
ncbi:hypothetical protein MH215_18910 [Paenibacillus sp. ACRSA]|uniref:hypothetical protein n=1 Tax=Paenibacillus sp. ACRSA TaxID=2918211 RepID=UPI001EF68137|nr:hypothetical protein [Paenibacillus sp. ACRSA]MCG7379088.1 hypothetical protein [Paenibacillus sp. ACRSA]